MMAHHMRIRVGLALSVGLVFVLVFPEVVRADFAGQVVGVIDGDSIRVMHEGKAEQIRLI